MGYHGDDGRMYDSSVGDGGSKGTSRTFSEGDTIGCGVDWSRSSVYYTLNGEHVGKYIKSTCPSVLSAADANPTIHCRGLPDLSHIPKTVSCHFSGTCILYSQG